MTLLEMPIRVAKKKEIRTRSSRGQFASGSRKNANIPFCYPPLFGPFCCYY